MPAILSNPNKLNSLRSVRQFVFEPDEPFARAIDKILGGLLPLPARFLILAMASVALRGFSQYGSRGRAEFFLLTHVVLTPFGYAR